MPLSKMHLHNWPGKTSVNYDDKSFNRTTKIVEKRLFLHSLRNCKYWKYHSQTVYNSCEITRQDSRRFRMPIARLIFSAPPLVVLVADVCTEYFICIVTCIAQNYLPTSRIQHLITVHVLSIYFIYDITNNLGASINGNLFFFSLSVLSGFRSY